MAWTEEKLDAICNLDGDGFRKALFGEFLKQQQNVEAEEVLEPADVTNSSFKGPESDIPIRIYTPESK
jgi:hypothetical protein